MAGSVSDCTTRSQAPPRGMRGGVLGRQRRDRPADVPRSAVGRRGGRPESHGAGGLARTSRRRAQPPADIGRALQQHRYVGVGVRAGNLDAEHVPPLQGGVQAGSKDDLYRRRRQSIDPDDYTGGFAIWSGTSFAAPYVAGAIAAQLAPVLMSAPDASPRSSPRRRSPPGDPRQGGCREADARRARGSRPVASGRSRRAVTVAGADAPSVQAGDIADNAATGPSCRVTLEAGDLYERGRVQANRGRYADARRTLPPRPRRPPRRETPTSKRASRARRPMCSRGSATSTAVSGSASMLLHAAGCRETPSPSCRASSARWRSSEDCSTTPRPG